MIERSCFFCPTLRSHEKSERSRMYAFFLVATRIYMCRTCKCLLFECNMSLIYRNITVHIKLAVSLKHLLRYPGKNNLTATFWPTLSHTYNTEYPKFVYISLTMYHPIAMKSAQPVRRSETCDLIYQWQL